ncbi:Glutamine--fructose-6-phosphate aminotransferase [isomerizing] [Candidatus Lokiarchaeum ossiferum]|uniref:Glutamine--fructose-6-phosphate aminotransferase [isomerizing] n=1 Tax=Candidatus Lokiarchaeum ossiferum TaxID=2951803 RepID=A0ABY6HUN6_9ARCH|nr:Glutamine--fructose-6-phosphate aminotransferase [isomerizing] [Candidatus Lokiarchaeum sp. B-35]
MIIETKLGKKTISEIWQVPMAIQKSVFQKQNRALIREISRGIISSGCVSIYIFGSGTSYHAGLVSTYWFSQLAKFPTHCELAPEFPYLIEPIIAPKHVAICISQSGESELTVYSAQKSKDKGAHVIAITNNESSTITKIAGHRTLVTQAGPEESILATKTYISELAVLAALAIDLAFLRKKISDDEYNSIWDEFKTVPKLIELTLPLFHKEIRTIAPFFKFSRNCFVIGAGPDYANCMEAALKLKEGARIFSQAFSTAETPHGPITLLSDPRDAFVLCIIPRPEAESRHKDIVKLISRLKKRGVTILGIKNPIDDTLDLDIAIDIPKCSEIFHPLFSIIPVQLLVVEIATIQNIDCDRPKDLSKISSL